MSGFRISLDSDAVLDQLDRIDAVAASPDMVMSAIAGAMVTAAQRHIETETGPDGRWPALSPRTVNARRGRSGRRGPDNMLRVKGRLYASIVGESSATEAVVGTNAIQAAILQFGGTVKIPERQQDINLSLGKGRRRFVKASAKRKETRRVTVGAHGVTIPARPYIYLSEADVAGIVATAAEAFGGAAGVEIGRLP